MINYVRFFYLIESSIYMYVCMYHTCFVISLHLDLENREFVIRELGEDQAELDLFVRFCVGQSHRYLA